jgi:hypothetical protein
MLLGALVCAAAAFGVTYWTGKVLNQAFPVLGIGPHRVLASSLAIAVVVFLLATARPIAGGAALATLGVIVSLPANPLYSGLAPYTSGNLTSVFTSVPGSASAGWVSFAGPPVANELIASGLTTLNAVSLYPNPAAWRVLDPSGSMVQIWNTYANLTFVAKSGLSKANLVSKVGPLIEVDLDPCGSQLRQLGVHFIVSTSPLGGGCLSLVNKTQLFGSPIFVYTNGP